MLEWSPWLALLCFAAGVRIGACLQTARRSASTSRALPLAWRRSILSCSFAASRRRATLGVRSATARAQTSLRDE
jgi:hypothetical protein